MASLFINRQNDGFYRPLTFISLWFDYKWLGTYWPGYHIQSILIHLVNISLICKLAIRLGLKTRVAWMAAAFFGVAPVTFETVLWPAARFDLLAAMFTLLSLLTALDLVKNEHAGPWKRILLAVFVAAGLLNKESAYCLLPLLCFLLATRNLWGLESVKRSNALNVLGIVAAITALGLIVRIVIYHGLGGYPATSGSSSSHFHLSLKTIETLVTRVLAVAPFTVNVSAGMSVWLYFLCFCL